MTTPFSGLEDRFQANAVSIYNKYTTRDIGNGETQDQPFLEFKPTDPNAEQTANDTRSNPVGSTARDIARIKDFLSSPGGMVWIAKDTLLQTGNTFTETQAENPTFIISNITPYLHIPRPFTYASLETLVNDNGRASPPTYDMNIGMAGRLQQATAATVTQDVLNAQGPAGVIATLNPGNLVSIIANALSPAPAGPEGINLRPELNFGGQYFSISVWQGFIKRVGAGTNLGAAASDLLSGNIAGAASNVLGAAANVLGVGGLVNAIAPGVAADPRSDPTNTDMDGYRYFITDPADADRYMINSIGFTTNPDNIDVPIVTLSQLDVAPYLLPPAPTPDPLFANINTSTINSLAGALSSVLGGSTNSSQVSNASLGNFVNQANQSNAVSQQNTALSLRSPLSTLASQGFTGAAASALTAITNFATTFISTIDDPADNPGEASMLFDPLSLAQRYNNSTDPTTEVGFIQQVLNAQQTYETNYWQANQPQMGFVGGLGATGQPLPIDPKSRNSSTRYFHDRLNDIGVITQAGTNLVSNATINNIQQNFGVDLVNVMFFDYVNSNAIPFRAFLMNIQENVTPEVNDTRYIGRIDRNVVYVGVTREVSFGLYVHAMNDTEMSNVWQKVNYMTGLCYPAKYANGFMVPPLVRLTIGDFYRDQPGYIRSLTHQIEQDTPWEITPGLQVPHGILMNVTFNVIEKTQMQAGSNFYPFAIPRQTTS